MRRSNYPAAIEILDVGVGYPAIPTSDPRIIQYVWMPSVGIGMVSNRVVVWCNSVPQIFVFVELNECA